MSKHPGTWRGKRPRKRQEGIDLMAEQERAASRQHSLTIGGGWLHEPPTITHAELREAIAKACQQHARDHGRGNIYDIAADAAFNLIARKLSRTP